VPSKLFEQIEQMQNTEQKRKGWDKIEEVKERRRQWPEKVI